MHINVLTEVRQLTHPRHRSGNRPIRRILRELRQRPIPTGNGSDINKLGTNLPVLLGQRGVEEIPEQRHREPRKALPVRKLRRNPSPEKHIRVGQPHDPSPTSSLTQRRQRSRQVGPHRRHSLRRASQRLERLRHPGTRSEIVAPDHHRDQTDPPPMRTQCRHRGIELGKATRIRRTRSPIELRATRLLTQLRGRGTTTGNVDEPQPGPRGDKIREPLRGGAGRHTAISGPIAGGIRIAQRHVHLVDRWRAGRGGRRTGRARGARDHQRQHHQQNG